MLTLEQIEILRSLVKSEQLSIDDVTESYSKVDFPDWKTDLLCNLINEEFMAKGIKENWEPNTYGLALEDLLDEINRRRLRG